MPAALRRNARREIPSRRACTSAVSSARRTASDTSSERGSGAYSPFDSGCTASGNLGGASSPRSRDGAMAGSYAGEAVSRVRGSSRGLVGYGGAMSQMYDLTLPSIHGEPVALEQFRGKVLLIINVASY
jgi:hypothetical protein